MKGLYVWVGFDVVVVFYVLVEWVNGVSSYCLLCFVGLVLDGFMVFIIWLLWVVSVVGSVFVLCVFVYGVYLIFVYLLYGYVVSGWMIIVVGLMLFLGI